MDIETAEAARVLFGSAAARVPFERAAVQQAFRKKALELHPDRFAHEPPQAQRTRTERFQQVSAAYERLLDYLSRGAAAWPREVGPSGRTPSPRSAARTSPPPRAAASEAPSPSTAPEPPLPGIPFRLGTFLRRRGAVSAAELAAALGEQSRGRARLGDVAVRWGWVSKEQADAVARAARPLERFGETALRLGLALTAEQISRLLWYQRAQQRRLGAWLVEKGVLSAPRLEALLAELSRHNSEVRRRGGWEERLGPHWERMNQPL